MSAEEKMEALQIHVEGLQATLTKRNIRIAELEKQVESLKKNPMASAAEKKAYRQGWRDCAGKMMEITRMTSLELSKIRKEAFEIYLEGGKR